MKKPVLHSGRKINTSRAVALGFAALILLGAGLLMLPFASRESVRVSFFDALFTATSATCVTGLVVFDTYSAWTLFGQAVIIALIQIGGLGFMSVLCVVYFALNKSIGMRGRMMLAEGISTDSMSGIVRIVKGILAATLIVEGTGAAVLSCLFVPRFGFVRGIWYGVFHSISAFCNAGFDLMGSVESGIGMIAVNDNPAVLLTLTALIRIGGLGFLAWQDIFMLLRRKKRRLRLQTRLVLITSTALTAAGFVLFWLLEGNGAFSGMSVIDRLSNALFQSATARTAGFAAVDQSELCGVSKLLTIVLMMIGGSSGSTAGGFKTATLAVAIVSAAACLRGKKRVVIFSRTIRPEQIQYAFSLILISAALVITGAAVISAESAVSIGDALYETASAYGTAGLTVGVTAAADPISRGILLVYMFFGRVGIMTITLAAVSRRQSEPLEYPPETVMIG